MPNIDVLDRRRTITIPDLEAFFERNGNRHGGPEVDHLSDLHPCPGSRARRSAEDTLPRGPFLHGAWDRVEGAARYDTLSAFAG